jgi:hypothetical protein
VGAGAAGEHRIALPRFTLAAPLQRAFDAWRQGRERVRVFTGRWALEAEYDPGIGEHRHQGVPIFDLREDIPTLVPALSRPVTQLRLKAWAAELEDFAEDPSLLHCLEYGFPSRSECAPISVWAKNWPSALGEHEEAMCAGIEDDIRLGRISVHTRLPFWPIRISPLGSVAKKVVGAAGPAGAPPAALRRRTSDLSFPPGLSVNDGIDIESLPRVHLATVADAAARVVQLRAEGGDGASIEGAKVDIEAAYRNIAAQEPDLWQTTYLYKGRFLVDHRLTFGSSSSPSHFSRVSRGVQHAMRRRGFEVLVYLDDFLILELGRERTQLAVSTLCLLLSSLGLPVQAKKLATEGSPSTTCTFLGIVLDTVRMELRLGPERLSAIDAELRQWRERARAPLRQVSSLVGVLNFAATVIRPGRLYMSRLIQPLRRRGPAAACTAGPRRYSATVELTAGFRADLDWWLEVMPLWNGCAMMRSAPPPVDFLDLETDASDWGCGGHCQGIFFSCAWPEDMRGWSINARELAAVVMAFVVLGREFHRHHVSVSCDNMAAVAVLQRGHASCPRMTGLMRALHVSQTIHDFAYTAEHLPGVANTAADLLSRKGSGGSR